ncbi:hypothetical protein H072_2754 [Dactylellina haptotyla CBS 200.50]|uniref:Large ribosomal subunit protein mL50 n=1 Tax=Dactylellina haptotyla (strain CBS 200.50) TaxID=1284197 RepID=S8AK12_DACHA|nr:hypothetical protein H072_2754 [Dactylellina haptotyla CBS 200.50]
MKTITARLSRVVLNDLPHASRCPTVLARRTLHTSPSTFKNDGENLTNAQQWRKLVWGEAGAADPYRELTPEERERREIELLEAEDAKRAQKQAAEIRSVKDMNMRELREEYAPDTDARSMLIVGTRGAFMKKKWDPQNRVWRYLTTRLSEPEEITAAVRRAVVETYSLAIARSKPTAACVNYRGPEYLTDRVQITKTENGKDFKFDFKNPNVMKRIQEYAKNKQPLQTDQDIVKDIPKAEGDEWMGMTLGGERLKFAVVKRTMQLTGLPLTDPVINDISTVGQLVKRFHRIAAQADTERLAPALAENEQLVENPNVTLHQYQLRFTDKERAIGRLETIPIMMAGRVKREGEIIGKGVGRGGRKRVSRSMMRLRARKMKAWGVNGIEKLSPRAIPAEA